ncbi:hypothetical protein LCGC14_2887910, partial [marine sediment metagenome]
MARKVYKVSGGAQIVRPTNSRSSIIKTIIFETYEID